MNELRKIAGEEGAILLQNTKQNKQNKKTQQIQNSHNDERRFDRQLKDNCFSVAPKWKL